MTRKTTLETARQGCRAPRSGALAALLACAALGLAAAPARAGNEFKNGFEDQIGRLLAFQVFQAGQVILGAPGYGYGYAWAVRPAPRPLYPPRHWHHAHRHPRREPCAWERESSRGRGSARR